MNIAYDCVAIWVGSCRRDLLLDIFAEEYGVSSAREGQAYRSALALFYYRDKPHSLFWSNEKSKTELRQYMEDKRESGTVDTYCIIDYADLVRECREWTHDY